MAEADRRRVLFHAVEGYPFGRVPVQSFDEVGALHEHASRSTGRVEHTAIVGFDYVDDHLDERNRREEFPTVVRLLVGKLGQEVFIDAPKMSPLARLSAGSLKVRRICPSTSLPSSWYSAFGRAPRRVS